jgi:CrcB protein
MRNVFFVGFGGFLGSVGRYGLSSFVLRVLGESFPYGTLAVNAIGCFFAGCLFYLVEDRALLGDEARLFLAVGVLGGFTTFSAFGYETMEQLQAREGWSALMNITGNVILGLAAAWLGRAVFRQFGF